MKKAIFSLLILISFSAFSQNVVIFQNGNTQPMQFITDSLKQRVDSCSTAIQNGGGGGGVTTSTPNGVRYFDAAGVGTSNGDFSYDHSLLKLKDLNSNYELHLGNYFKVYGQNGIYSNLADEIISDYNFTTSTYRYANGAIKSTPTAALDITGAVKLNSLTNTPSPANKMMVFDSLTKGVAYVDIPAIGGGGASNLEDITTLGAATSHNLIIGGQTVGYGNDSTLNNSVFGIQALGSNTTGSYNIANGIQALYFNTTGSHNTAIGRRSLFNNSTGSYNTAIGSRALSDNSIGNNNVGIGAYANVTDFDNSTAIGAFATVLQSNSMVLGAIAGINSATISTNVGIGTTAPQAALHIVNTSASLTAVIIDNIGTYADDAAAGTAGLTAGMLYKTSVGGLMIKL